MNIGLSYVVEGCPERTDIKLAGAISTALGTSLESLIRDSISKVEQSTGLKADWEGLNVRCYQTEKPKQGLAFRDLEHGQDGMPDIILGFTGDVEDFTITLNHELLHLVRWDEQILDKRATEIYTQSNVGISELLQLENLDDILNNLPGDYDRIRKLRKKLDEPARGLFDKILLIGFREGILLNLYQKTSCCPIETNPDCSGCEFLLDYGATGKMCRLGHEPGTYGCRVVKRLDEDK